MNLELEQLRPEMIRAMLREGNRRSYRRIKKLQKAERIKHPFFKNCMSNRARNAAELLAPRLDLSPEQTFLFSKILGDIAMEAELYGYQMCLLKNRLNPSPII